MSDEESAVTSGSQAAETDDPGTDQRLPMTDLQMRALISDRGSIGSVVWQLACVFVGALILTFPLIFVHGRSLSVALPIAIVAVIVFLVWSIWNRHESHRDIKAKVFVRYHGPLTFDGPGHDHVVLGTYKVLVLDDERPALEEVIPCRGEADIAPHAKLIFEIRDENSQVIYTGAAMREVLGQKT